MVLLYFFNSCSTQIEENLEALHESILFCQPQAESSTLKAIQKC